MEIKKYAAPEETTHMSLSLLTSAKVKNYLEVCKHITNFNFCTNEV